MAIWKYAPNQVSVSLAGIYDVIGFVDGEFIRVIKTEDETETYDSMDGESMRIYNDNDTYTVEITISQSSPSNTILGVLWQLDRATRRAKFPIAIVDSSGSSRFYSATAWVSSQPPMVFGNSLTEVTWKLTCKDAVIFYGDNTGSVLSDVTSVITVAASALSNMRA